ncbi:MAG TPA: diaminopimelate epimerase [Acidimicrobiales bacterium]|nr:diaminopimelate epimerase [Acidimicrobiales bacterium]
MSTLHLTKHHGLGNDFLVLLDPEGATEVTADLARALCERREGIGADGLLHVRKATDGADLELTVWNADGSVAETSGNGLRCAGQAAVDAGLAGPDLFVRTGGEVRSLTAEPEIEPGLRRVSVTMGIPKVGEDEPELLARLLHVPDASRAVQVDTGNPHLVVLVRDVEQLDSHLMERMSRAVVGHPVNLEGISPKGSTIAMRVWERGVGETRACGSGAVAVAAASKRWGLTGDQVEVAMPGGMAIVTLRPNGEAVLTGPAKFIGRIEVDPDRISP